MRPMDFDVGDDVYVTTKNQDLKHRSHKLVLQMAGLYKILSRKGYSFELDLPNSIRVYPVFLPNKLRKATNDPLLGQVEPEPEPIEVNRSMEQEVEKILGVRLVRRKLKYRVKQKGFDDDPDEYFTADLRNTLLALQ